MAKFELTEDGRMARPLAPSKTGIVIMEAKKGWRVKFDGTEYTKVIPKSHVNLLEEFIPPTKVFVRPFEVDNIGSFEDLRRRFVRDFIKANPKPEEFILASDNINVLRAYEKMTKTGYYENLSNQENNPTRL